MSQLGAILLPGELLESLETFLIVTLEGYYWHLVDTMLNNKNLVPLGQGFIPPEQLPPCDLVKVSLQTQGFVQK